MRKMCIMLIWTSLVHKARYENEETARKMTKMDKLEFDGLQTLTECGIDGGVGPAQNEGVQ